MRNIGLIATVWFFVVVSLFSGFACASTPGNINACQELNVAGKYILTTNLNESAVLSNGCFNITSSNVVLDCQNYFIRNTSLAKSGIYAENVNNITVENCNVSMYSGSGGKGMYLANVSNSQILTSNLEGNQYGIWLRWGSNNSVISTNMSYNAWGIIISLSENNTIRDISSRDNSQTGLAIEFSSRNNFTGINSTGNGQYGFSMGASGSNILTESNFNGNRIGLRMFSSSSYNTISFVNASNNSFGVEINSWCTDNNLSGIIANNNSNTGVYLTTSSDRNIFSNVTANSNVNFGVEIESSLSNTLNGITTNYNLGRGVYLFSGSTNNILTNLTANNNQIGLSFDSSGDNFADNINSALNTLYGISLSDSSNNNLSSLFANSNVQHGLYIINSANNSISNSSFYNSSGAILLSSSEGNSFTNLSFVNTTRDNYDIWFPVDGTNNNTKIIDSFLGSYFFNVPKSTLLVKDSRYGEIKFLNGINGSGLNLSSDIQILNNSVHVNSSQTGLNVNANITLYGLSTNIINPAILIDGLTVCNEATSPSCHNFTALNSGTVSFNISSWNNNYTIGTYYSSNNNQNNNNQNQGPSSSSGGGGGGGGGASASTYTLNDKDFSDGEQRELAVNDQFKVSIGSENHYVKLSDLSPMGITIIISSNPQQASLMVGETKQFDVNEDGNIDLEVTLLRIGMKDGNAVNASIEIKKSSGIVATTPLADVKEKEEKTQIQNVQQNNTSNGSSNIMMIVWITLGIGIIVLAILIIRVYNKNRLSSKVKIREGHHFRVS